MRDRERVRERDRLGWLRRASKVTGCCLSLEFEWRFKNKHRKPQKATEKAMPTIGFCLY